MTDNDFILIEESNGSKTLMRLEDTYCFGAEKNENGDYIYFVIKQFSLEKITITKECYERIENMLLNGISKTDKENNRIRDMMRYILNNGLANFTYGDYYYEVHFSKNEFDELENIRDILKVKK